MNKFRICVSCFFLWVLVAACHRGNGITIINGDDNLQIHYDGEIQFNPEETLIAGFSRNGYLDYRRNGKKLEAHLVNGQVVYRLSDDGQSLNPQDAKGKEFIADIVKDLIDVGFDAKGRMKRLYHEGGASAVLDAVEHLKMDNLKSSYIQFAIESDSVSTKDLAQAAKIAGSEIGNDWEKAQVLDRFPVEFLHDSLTARAWFESVKNIGADYEKSNLLISVARKDISPKLVNQVLDVSNSIGGDYEKANVLRSIISKRNFSPENFDKALDAIGYLGSDFDKANLLSDLISRERPSADHFLKFTDAIEHVGGDYDRSRLVSQMIQQGMPDSLGLSKLLRLIIHTGSDYDHVNMIRELSAHPQKTPSQWIELLEATAHLDNETDKSNLLVGMAPDLPKDEAVKAAYLQTARTISQEYDLGRAMKALP